MVVEVSERSDTFENKIRTLERSRNYNFFLWVVTEMLTDLKILTPHEISV